MRAENCKSGGKLSLWYSTGCQDSGVMLRRHVSTAVARVLSTSRCVASVFFSKQANTRFALPSSHSLSKNLLPAAEQKTARTVFFAAMSSKTGLGFSFLDVVSPTIEAVTLNAISGILAQAFTAYKAKVTYHLQPGKIKETALTIFTGSVCSGPRADPPVHAVHRDCCGTKLHIPDSVGKVLSHKDCAQDASGTSARQRQEE